MHRFYLPPEAAGDRQLTLPEDQSHHAKDVLRLRAGDGVSVLDGHGREYHCRIAALDRKRVLLDIVHAHDVPRLPYSLVLLQGVPRGKTMDWIVQKAAELGATRIVPLVSERSVPDWDEEQAAQKAARWQEVAVEAIKQCGAAWLPRVERPVFLRNFLAQDERFDLVLVASLQPGSQHPRQYFDRYRAERGRLPATIAVWVG